MSKKLFCILSVIILMLSICCYSSVGMVTSKNDYFKLDNGNRNFCENKAPHRLILEEKKNIFQTETGLTIFRLYEEFSKIDHNKRWTVKYNDNEISDDGLDQYQLYCSAGGWVIAEDWWYAQSFVPSFSRLAMVKLRLSIGNSPIDNIYVNIRSSLTGPDLTSSYRNASMIPRSGSTDWISFDFQDINVQPGKTYYIVVSSPKSLLDVGDYAWWSNNDRESYSSGRDYNSPDGGLTWFDGEADFCFKTYFCPPAEQTDQVQTDLGYWSSNWTLVGESRWFAQSFTPSLTTLTKLELLTFPSQDADNIYLKIRKDLNGFDLISISLTPNGIPPSPQVLTFDFPDINVTPGLQYYIIVCSPESSLDFKCWRWLSNYQYDPYYLGKTYISENDGIIWYERLEIFDFWFKTYGYNGSQPTKPFISGTTEGKAGKEYGYTGESFDPDDDRIKYLFNWDDGTYTWTYYYNTSELANVSHIWNQGGTYRIRVKAKDENGAQSDWSEPLVIIMPKNKLLTCYKLFFKFLEEYPCSIPILG